MIKTLESKHFSERVKELRDRKKIIKVSNPFKVLKQFYC